MNEECLSCPHFLASSASHTEIYNRIKLLWGKLSGMSNGCSLAQQNLTMLRELIGIIQTHGNNSGYFGLEAQAKSLLDNLEGEK